MDALLNKQGQADSFNVLHHTKPHNKSKGYTEGKKILHAGGSWLTENLITVRFESVAEGWQSG